MYRNTTRFYILCFIFVLFQGEPCCSHPKRRHFPSWNKLAQSSPRLCSVSSKQNLGKLHRLANKFGLVTKYLQRMAAYAGLNYLVAHHQHQGVWQELNFQLIVCRVKGDAHIGHL